MSPPWAGCSSSPFREEGLFSKGICPMSLHHRATKTTGMWRCRLSLLARLVHSSTPFITLLYASPNFPISFSASGCLLHPNEPLLSKVRSLLLLTYTLVGTGGSRRELSPPEEYAPSQPRWSIFWRCFLPSEKKLSLWAPDRARKAEPVLETSGAWRGVTSVFPHTDPSVSGQLFPCCSERLCLRKRASLISPSCSN